MTNEHLSNEGSLIADVTHLAGYSTETNRQLEIGD